MKRHALGLLATVLGAALPFAAVRSATPSLPAESRVPGGIALIELGSTAAEPGQVFFNGHRTPVVRSGEIWTAVVGIPLDIVPGPQAARFVRPDRQGTRDLAFEVTPKLYAEQRLTVQDQRQVDPNEADLERIDREQARIDRALSIFSTDLTPPWQMTTPVPGRRSSSFGLRRFFNGQSRKPHSGMDIAAPTGTPIVNPAAGRVVEAGDFFFNGNTVFVDHGLGVVTMYCHLSRIDVKPGETIAAGRQLGLVGATGRVTGPHLHWGIGVNRAMVDPVLFLPPEAQAPPAAGR